MEKKIVSNVATAISLLNRLAEIAPAVSTAGQVLAAPAPAADPNALIKACWQQVAKASPIVGVDALNTARIHALNFGNTAEFAARSANTEKQKEAYRSIAAAYYKIHDGLAGVSWYTMPGTKAALRSESRQMQESAEIRKLLAAIAGHLADLKKAGALSEKTRR